jgi:hypothetical protein
MKRLLKVLFAFAGLILLVVLGSCKKYVAGPKGEPGTPGENGNLKMTHILYTASSWSFGTTNGWESHLQSAKISNNVLTKGEVETYMQIGDDWWSLPYGVGDVFMEVSFDDGWVHFKYFKIHGGPPAKPDTVNFRIVILEPA